MKNSQAFPAEAGGMAAGVTGRQTPTGKSGPGSLDTAGSVLGPGEQLIIATVHGGSLHASSCYFCFQSSAPCMPTSQTFPYLVALLWGSAILNYFSNKKLEKAFCAHYSSKFKTMDAPHFYTDTDAEFL